MARHKKTLAKEPPYPAGVLRGDHLAVARCGPKIPADKCGSCASRSGRRFEELLAVAWAVNTRSGV
jgi:hypothetical protein